MSLGPSSGGAGGDAFTTDSLAQFAATTSAQLAGVISDETGSGALVFATSPTLVTPALGAATATSLTLTTDLAIADGGTGQSTQAAAFDALAPTTTRGDIIRMGAADNERLALGGVDQIVKSDGTDTVYGDPAIQVTLIHSSTSAVAAGAQTQGNGGSTSLVTRYLVPTGKSLKITHVSWGWDTGAGVGTWTLKVIVRVNGATTTVLDTITTAVASTTGADSAEGTLASPLATLAAGDLVQIGWLNDATSPGPMGTNNKGVYVTGVLV